MGDNITQKQLNSYRERSAKNDTEASRKYDKWRTCDPYPSIEPSLLNCADYCDYVAETGMVHPFHFEEEDVKLATYAFRIKGDVVWWADDGSKKSYDITEGKDFVLEGNSIYFVSLEPYLRLPDYIALRFNLKIEYVYKGLLLGTGPIVDPGYQGYLSVPLHNLTNRDYTLTGGDPLIWVEFTKLSNHPRWCNKNNKHTPQSRYPFLYDRYPDPSQGEERDVNHHLDRAVGVEGVISSIPNAINDAKDAAERARSEAQSVSIKSQVVVIASLIGVVVGIVVGLYSLIQVQRTYENEVRSLREHVHQQQRVLDRLRSNNPDSGLTSQPQNNSRTTQDSEN